MNKILVVAPHSDDETLGAGGYLLKHRDMGDELFWINITNVKKEYGYSNDEIKYWNERVEKVRNEYQFKEFFDLALEPAGIDKIDKADIIKSIKDIINKIKPNIVVVPYYNDAHSDHRVVFDAVMACCKSFRCPYVEKILCMETISETEYSNPDFGFFPNYFVDISEYIDMKIDILRIYDSEISESPFPRNIEAIKGLAKFRGGAATHIMQRLLG